MSSIHSAGAVCTPHYLASITGRDVLADGGNAIDAIVAANITLAVVAPYYCGFGGDLFAVVWDGDLHGYLGAGRAPEAATLDNVRARTEQRPLIGPLSITVPGAVQGWFDLLERFGTRSFIDLCSDAIGYARFGFMLTTPGAARVRRSLEFYPGMVDLHGAFGNQRPGDWLAQPRTAELIELLATSGPDAYYRGAVADSIGTVVEKAGGLLQATDLAVHTGEWVHPLRVPYRDREIVELPPPTQGVTALEALRILDDDVRPPGLERTHRMIEAVKLALADRDANVADPTHMELDALELLTDSWVGRRRAQIDPARAIDPVSGYAQPGDTAYMCAADDNGLRVSLIQSNYLPFGSGVRVPDWGITLQNRGSSFRLDAGHPNAWAPGKRPLHTLVPAMIMRDGQPEVLFGSMGGDTQIQIHTQFVTGVVDDRRDVGEVIASPRWRVDPGTWKVHVEPTFDEAEVEGLRRLGHEVVVDAADAGDDMGHAAAIARLPVGFAAAADPRSEGLASGL